jgi:hypothetical protein
MGTIAKPITILTVDDHALLRKGIAAPLNAGPDKPWQPPADWRGTFSIGPVTV